MRWADRVVITTVEYLNSRWKREEKRIFDTLASVPLATNQSTTVFVENSENYKLKESGQMEIQKKNPYRQLEIKNKGGGG